MPAPPTPFHILRSHSAPLATLAFDPTNTLLYAGDQDGHISVTDLRSRRLVNTWHAHEGGVLTLQEWNGRLISHGRDNQIHFYERLPSHGPLSSRPSTSRPPLKVESTLTTNSLNFCRFSLCPVPSSGTSAKGKERESEALLAVPNLIDSELVDIYLLPTKTRLHASINYVARPKASYQDTDSIRPPEGRTGLVMGIHLGFDELKRLTCVMGFEDGRIEVWRCGRKGAKISDLDELEMEEEWRQTWDARMSAGAALWNKVWEAKGHNEAVMAMAVDTKLHRAFTVSADHLVVRYDIRHATTESGLAVSILGDNAVKTFSTGQIGNASISVSADGAVVAIGGWDGKIRLFSATSLKPLGVLAYHRETVHSVIFANPPLEEGPQQIDQASTLDLGDEVEDSDEDEGEMGMNGEVPRSRWMASGGKDRRIALWGLKDFAS